MNRVRQYILTTGFVLAFCAISSLVHAANQQVYVSPAGNDVTGNGTQATPYATIQHAIIQSSDSDTVIVCDGVYTGQGNHTISFMGKAITVRSENGADNCVVDCEGYDGFIFENGETNTSTVRGLTIVNGYNGVYTENTTPIVIGNSIEQCICGIGTNAIEYGFAECLIIDSNIITENEIGISLSSEAFSVRVINNRISSNTSDGFVFGPNVNKYYAKIAKIELGIVNAEILNNCISENGGCGLRFGGIEFMGLIESNSILNNKGDGIYFSHENSPVILKNIIVGNQGYGLHLCMSEGPIMNNLITGNSLGGMNLWVDGFNAPTDVYNNTITGNGGQHGCAIRVIDSGALVSIKNNIINNGGESEIYLGANEGPTNVLIAFNSIRNGFEGVEIIEDKGIVNLTWGDGNISDPPLFVNPIDGDYQLLNTSPCLGAGIVTGAPSTDILGNTRGTPPDMGAYENPLDTPVDGSMYVWEGVLHGLINQYCYTWDGYQYVPISCFDYSHDPASYINPWQGFWVILNNENMYFDGIDLLVPKQNPVPDEVPSFTAEPGKHYLFSLPLETAETDLNTSSLGQQLGDGKYENTWRVGRWKWNAGSYCNYLGPGKPFSDVFTLQPGKGFWFQQITDDPITIALDGTKVDPAEYYPITLPRNELDQPYTYHMVGNPYWYPVPWYSMKMRVPMTPGQTVYKTTIDPVSINEWHINLGLISIDGMARDTYNRVGVVSSSDPAVMRAFDLEPVGKYIRLTVANPNTQTPQPVAYDYRLDGDRTYTWQINLTTNYKTIDTYLSLDNIVDVPEDYSLVLTDDRTGVSYTVADDYSMSITLQEGIGQTFTLVATTMPTAIDEFDEPVAFGIQSTMPNPFNPVTTIQYALTEYTDVQIRVYNVNGQIVDTLVDSRMRAGINSVVWNAQGQASGMYFISLEAGGQRDVTKVMLMK